MVLNFAATLLLVKRLAPEMLGRGNGQRVNFSAIAYGCERGQSGYAVAKAVFAAPIRSLTMELGPLITVKCGSRPDRSTSENACNYDGLENSLDKVRLNQTFAGSAWNRSCQCCLTE
jgi:NADP-dependent 3-hydroxy acid dehydrogenase YdfG